MKKIHMISTHQTFLKVWNFEKVEPVNEIGGKQSNGGNWSDNWDWRLKNEKDEQELKWIP